MHYIIKDKKYKMDNRKRLYVLFICYFQLEVEEFII